ncbi:hypothetical protein EAF04_008033 [Stromatinia cepivora]|nr:hypothetical protein EAF04_008033 [Stromatinia cepivora]
MSTVLELSSASSYLCRDKLAECEFVRLKLGHRPGPSEESNLKEPLLSLLDDIFSGKSSIKPNSKFKMRMNRKLQSMRFRRMSPQFSNANQVSNCVSSEGSVDLYGLDFSVFIPKVTFPTRPNLGTHGLVEFCMSMPNSHEIAPDFKVPISN